MTRSPCEHAAWAALQLRYNPDAQHMTAPPSGDRPGYAAVRAWDGRVFVVLVEVDDGGAVTLRPSFVGTEEQEAMREQFAGNHATTVEEIIEAGEDDGA